MRILILHSNFPAQYKHIVPRLVPDHEVVCVAGSVRTTMPGVRTVRYSLNSRGLERRGPVDRFRVELERATMVRDAMLRLRTEGFVPDIVLHHAGLGGGTFIGDVFPKSRALAYLEWYYDPNSEHANFLRELSVAERSSHRLLNTAILHDLVGSSAGVVPTAFQRRQFPAIAMPIRQIHDGVDTRMFTPARVRRENLLGFPIPEDAEIVTYVARGMEPYRGFPQFMRAIGSLQRLRPKLHAMIVGEDRVAYGTELPAGTSWKSRMLEEVRPDPKRTHFTGYIGSSEYLAVLRASSVHVYLTYPFVLSWSVLEALSVGCVVVASDTAPVREVIVAGQEGLLVDFFDADAIVHAVTAALEMDEPVENALRGRAREFIQDCYSADRLVPKQLEWVFEVANGGDSLQ